MKSNVETAKLLKDKINAVKSICLASNAGTGVELGCYTKVKLAVFPSNLAINEVKYR
jgi:hypothetical protein